ncbi:MAG: spore coat associated protein CotJA [Bacillota bacterium]|nr:spore coat associated protein CotJA [Bacillota bacterium]
MSANGYRWRTPRGPLSAPSVVPDPGGAPVAQTYRSPYGTVPRYPRLAEAYVPIQNYDPGFDLTEALRKGTMFPSLYRPEFVVPCTSYRRYVATRFPRRMHD